MIINLITWLYSHLPVDQLLITTLMLAAVSDAAEEIRTQQLPKNAIFGMWFWYIMPPPVHLDFYHINQEVKRWLDWSTGALAICWFAEGGVLSDLEIIFYWFLWHEFRQVWYHFIFKAPGYRQIPVLRIPLFWVWPSLANLRF